MSPLRVSTDHSELDVALVHRYLAQHSSWARDIPLAVVQRSIANSLCFGGFLQGGQVAFARVVSDYATVAYLGDVFVLPEHQGKGYGKAMMDAVMAHPDLQGAAPFQPGHQRCAWSLCALRLHAAAGSAVADGALSSRPLHALARRASYCAAAPAWHRRGRKTVQRAA
ncbi:GNAT superfamily N-acetyltransferase [Xanthomonas arboricola]|uniref:GNAT superfamily N-acetyltransferase n=1 Tax=Xanthomonas arboricola TaxID=56448 RepID=A0AB73GXW7_9XANT|nr:GNAT superfamily N-acetyltransferase [Xanthomonas arboricola]